MSETVEQPPVETAEQQPPAESAHVEESTQQAAPPDEDAELETGAVVLPEGEGQTAKYVPLSAATTARKEAREAKRAAKETADKLAAAEKLLADSAPYVTAAKALLEQKPQPEVQQPAGPTAEETAELTEIAKDFDFYKTDGSLDLDRAKRHQDRVAKQALQIAQAQVQPLHQQTQLSKAQVQLEQAKAWEEPGTKMKADPAILTHLWNQIASQPNGLETLSNPQTAMYVWGQALNFTRWQKGAQPAQQPQQQQEVGEPIFTEKSGGQHPQSRAMTAMDKRTARELGMTDAEYQKEAAKMPWSGGR